MTELPHLTPRCPTCLTPHKPAQNLCWHCGRIIPPAEDAA